MASTGSTGRVSARGVWAGVTAEGLRRARERIQQREEEQRERYRRLRPRPSGIWALSRSATQDAQQEQEQEERPKAPAAQPSARKPPRPPDSTVMGVLGRRGMGKTLLITALGLNLTQMWRNAGLDCHLFANYWVGDRRTGVPAAEPLPEDIQGWLSNFPTDIDCGVLLLDELGAIVPSSKSMSNINSNFAAFIEQIRKRGLTVLWAGQSPRRLTSEMWHQTDIMSEAFSSDRGVHVQIRSWDMWGQWRTTAWGEQGKGMWPPSREPDAVHTLYGKPFFRWYDTRQVILPAHYVQQLKQQAAREERERRREERDAARREASTARFAGTAHDGGRRMSETLVQEGFGWDEVLAAAQVDGAGEDELLDLADRRGLALVRQQVNGRAEWVLQRGA